MGYEAHNPNAWCARCKQFKPRATMQDVVSTDGLRRRPMCLPCRTELRKQQLDRSETAERQE